MNNVHFAIPEIYGETLSYYELLRKLVQAMNVMIDNYDTIPDQIAEAVANLDASQLFSAVLSQLIDSIATDNTKSTNAVKVYKKHDLLYATFNDRVNLYESLIDFTAGTETELIIGTNIREVNISELFIELRKLIDDEALKREQADQILQQSINTEKLAREQADQILQQSINTEKLAREQADQILQQAINAEKLAREQAVAGVENKNKEQDTEIENLNTGLSKKNKTFTLANTDQNGDITLLDNFRNYNFLLILLVSNSNEFLSTIYIPTELINDSYKVFPSYTSETQIVVYITIVNGTTIRCTNNGNGHKIIVAGIDKI